MNTITIRIMGSKGLTFNPDIIHTFKIGDDTFVAHRSHNKLIHTLVFSHLETGVPVQIYNVAPTDELNKALSQKYVPSFEKFILEKGLPSLAAKAEKINEVPPAS